MEITLTPWRHRAV